MTNNYLLIFVGIEFPLGSGGSKQKKMLDKQASANFMSMTEVKKLAGNSHGKRAMLSPTLRMTRYQLSL